MSQFEPPASADEHALITGLEKALAGEPDNIALRLHLAQLLLRAGRAEAALEQAQLALAQVPDRLDALEVAAQAASTLGSDEQAQGFRRLSEALRSAAGEQVGVSFETEREEPEEKQQVVRLKAISGGRKASDEGEAERPTVTLEDVGGMEQVKRRLQTAFLAPLANPQLRRMYAKSLRGGLLLYGPPGCGKTFIARATAGQLAARFLAVGLHEILDMYLGESERKLHELFQQARRNAPCVLFFDEVDALGRKRSQLRESAGRDVVVQLLAELDSFGSDNEGVFAFAATNHPWDVDTALRRPGRFDRMLLVLPPDEPARESIIRYHLRDRPAEGVDAAAIARMTPLYSGADLAHVCETAAEYALEDSIESGSARPIETGDLGRALEEVRPSTTAWLQLARNYAEFANEGGAYDELLAYLREQRLS